MTRHVGRRVACAGALAWAWASAAAGPAAAVAVPCRLVVGGGTVASPGFPVDTNDWNRLNFSFYDAVNDAFAADAKPVETLFFVAASGDDGARNADAVLRKALDRGCDEVVRTSVFGDGSADPAELVFRLSMAPVSAAYGGSLGAPTWMHEYRYPASDGALARVSPNRVGERAVRDALAPHPAADKP